MCYDDVKLECYEDTKARKNVYELECDEVWKLESMYMKLECYESMKARMNAYEMDEKVVRNRRASQGGLEESIGMVPAFAK